MGLSRRLLFEALGFLGFLGALYVAGPLAILAGLGLIVAGVIVLVPMVGLGLTIVTQVVTPLLGFFDVSGVALTLTRPLGALTLGSWLMWALRRREAFTISPQMVPLALFLPVLLFSVVVMPDREQSLIGAYRFAAVLILYVLVANLAAAPRRLLLVAAMVSLMATVSAGIAIVQYTTPSLAVVPDDPSRSKLDFGEGAIVDADSLESGPIKRVTGGMGESNFLACMLAAVLPLSVFWWRWFPRPEARAVVVLATGMQLCALVLSFTRAGILALGLAVAYLLVKRRLPVWPTMAVGFVLMVAALPLLPAGLLERFSFGFIEAGSTSIRMDLWAVAWQLIKEGGVLGHGYGQFGPELLRRGDAQWIRDLAVTVRPDDPEIHNIMPHNLLAEIAIEYGWIAVVLFVGFFIRIFRDARDAETHGDARERDLAVCLQAGVLAFLVCGVVVHGKLLKVLWMLAGLVAALRRVAFTERRSEGRQPAPTPLGADDRVPA
jgi:O-antigen ligase